MAYCERCGELLADDLHELVAFVVLKLDTLGVAHVALGQDGRDIPTLPPDLENLAREIRRSEVGVPVPAPRSNTEALAA